ncbi:MAG: cytochrome c [Chlorobiaceae bacterium]|nr:cytochrome c [Chlorobiaceae bacterium]NTV61821.1 cytochrome c [Chlorobiaceae bacterium]
MRTRTIAILAALSVLVVTGCGKKEGGKAKKNAMTAADSAAAASKQPFAMKEGRRLYNHYCGVCHGETGDGAGQYYGLTPTPANFTDRAFMKSLSDEVLFKSINEGSAAVGKSNMCPPWGNSFNPEEIEFIVGYIKTFSGR